MFYLIKDQESCYVDLWRNNLSKSSDYELVDVICHGSSLVAL